MNDDELLQQLRAAVEAADPPPSRVRDEATRASLWDVELAQLMDTIHDSSVGEAALRSAGDVRDLSFRIEETTIEVAIEPDGAGGLELSGRVTPPRDTLVVLLPGQSPTTIACDDDGRFEWGAFHAPLAVGFTGADGDIRRSELIFPT